MNSICRLMILVFAGIVIPSLARGIPIIADGNPNYCLDGASSTVLVQRFQRLCKQYYGSELPLESEKEKKPVLSLKVEQKKLAPKDYRIDGSRSGIRIVGGSEEALEVALNRFLAIAGGRQLELPRKISIRYHYDKMKGNNRKLIPKYRGRNVARLEPSDNDKKLYSPDWLKSLVMVEVRVDTASIGKSLKNPEPLLDFYAVLGVNAIWVTPVFERGPGGNGYGNVGLHRIEPALTGTTDQTEAHDILRTFVKAAHKRNIYVLFDVVTWGTMKGSTLHKEHPDWFNGTAWGNEAFDWKSEGLRSWFVNEAVELILFTDADGFRCDCEPHHAGEQVYGEIRKRLNAKGKYVIMIAEDGTARGETFDLEQDGVLDYSKMHRGQLFANPVNFYADGLLDIVASCKTGQGLGPAELQKVEAKRGCFRFYSNCISNHDFQTRNIRGDRLKFNYAAILAPFIPIWYCGDEFGMTAPKMVIYDQKIDFSHAESPSNAFFMEDVKSAIAIRRRFVSIFESFPVNHRDINIRPLKVQGTTGLPAYARYSDRQEILVVPNASKEEYIQVGICLDSPLRRKAINLRTNEKMSIGEDMYIHVVIPPRDVAIILTE